MIYIVISTKERSTKILANHITKKKYFTDLALAKKSSARTFLSITPPKQIKL